jgi:hypothetical protein
VRAGLGASTLASFFAVVQAAEPAPRLDLPRGYTASLYVSGIAGARDLAVAADGTLQLNGGAPLDRYEISPPTADTPVTVMRVAPELDAAEPPQAVRLFAYSPEARPGGSNVPVAPQTLALARTLEREAYADVALAPDGTLYVADSRAGAVWRVRRGRL